MKGTSSNQTPKPEENRIAFPVKTLYATNKDGRKVIIPPKDLSKRKVRLLVNEENRIKNQELESSESSSQGKRIQSIKPINLTDSDDE